MLENPTSGKRPVKSVAVVQRPSVSCAPRTRQRTSAGVTGFAFHGAGRTGPQCQAGDCAGFQSAMENDAALVYMTSIAGPSWGDDFDRNDAFFVALLDQLLATTCIDESRVFVAGTSSGATFSAASAAR